MEYPDHYKNRLDWIRRRRTLRQDMTRAEKLFWWQVRNKQLGYRFRRQFNIGRYIVDFYCHALKLIVEIDGYTHDYPKQKLYDEYRTKYLERLGFTLIRFEDLEVLSDTERTLTYLVGVMDGLKKSGDDAPELAEYIR